MLDKLKAGTPFAEVAAAAGLKVETKAEIKRGNALPPLSVRTIDAIFRTAKDGYGTAEAAAPGEQVVFRVTDITMPEVDAKSEEAKQLREALNRSFTEDVFGGYLGYLQRQVGVTINENALKQVVTGQSTHHQLSSPMQIEPQASAFAKRYARGEAQVVWTTLVADLETPVSAFLKIAGSRPLSFLLESVEGGAVRGRYSIIGLEPDVIWRSVAGRPRSIAPRAARAAASRRASEPPLEALRALVAESRDRAARRAAADGRRHLRLSRLRHGPADGEAAGAQSRSDRPAGRGAGAADHRRGVRRGQRHHHGGHAGASGKGRVGQDRAGAGERAALRSSSTRSTSRSIMPPPTANAGSLTVLPASNTTPAEYERMVQAAKEYIAAGDIFQVVLSQRFEAPFELPPFSLYRALRRVNPSPYLYFLDLGEFAIAGSSPEILVKVSGGTVTIRPIAGTRPRGATPHEDKALEAELLADPEGARRAPDAARPRPQRRRPRRPRSAPSRSPTSSSSSATAR